MIWSILAVVLGAGAVGGLLAGLFSPGGQLSVSDSSTPNTAPRNPEVGDSGRLLRERLLLVYVNPECNSTFPGLIGNMLLGGVAAVVFFGLYGPLSGATILGEQGLATPVGLTTGELASSVLVGMGGGTFLFTAASRRCSEEKLNNP